MDKYIKRDIYYQTKKTLEENQVPIIMGLRRIGKTTLLKILESEYKNAKIISFDSFENLSLSDSAFYNFLTINANQYDYLLLDEVQSRKNWDQMIKSLYDEYVADKKVKLVVTGSSSMILASKELGVNRTKRLIAETWDFDEYASLTKKEKNFSNFEAYLGRGGFPDYFDSKKTFSEIVNEILKPILEDDIPKGFPGINRNNLIRLVQKLSMLTNGEVNESSISNNLGIDIRTVRNYIYVLESARLLKRIFKINDDGSMPKKKQYKVYLNPHFHVMLLGKTFTSLENKYKGHIIESYWLHWAKSVNGYWKEFYYLKNKKNKEIDFVSLNVDGSFKTLHEFKYVNRLSSDDVANILQYDSTNKIIWCKNSGLYKGIKTISILDIKNN